MEALRRSSHINFGVKMTSFLAHEAAYRGNMNVLNNRADKDIRVCGVGAIGSWLIEKLARQGYNNITGIDMDKVEQNNIGTQNHGKQDVGRSKSSQCASNTMKRVGVSVKSVHRKVTSENVKSVVKGADLVVDVFDNADSRRLLLDICRDLGINCVHSGMSSNGFAEICWNEHYKIYAPPVKTPSLIPCEYPLAANLVHMTVALTAEVINRFFDEKVKQSLEFTIRDYKVCVMHTD